MWWARGDYGERPAPALERFSHIKIQLALSASEEPQPGGSEDKLLRVRDQELTRKVAPTPRDVDHDVEPRSSSTGNHLRRVLYYPAWYQVWAM